MTVVRLGSATSTTYRALEDGFRETQGPALGIASAFVTKTGVTRLGTLARLNALAEVRLVAGLGNCITHPEALAQAADYGWDVRVCGITTPLFHPKLLVRGSSFEDDCLAHPSFAYVGSANLTGGGLEWNIECGAMISKGTGLESASECFRDLWRQSDDLTPYALEDYRGRFSRANALRRQGEIELASTMVGEPLNLEGQRGPARVALEEAHARTVWVGLQSMTGDYRYQVEFPRRVADALRNVLGGHDSVEVQVLCEDGNRRAMLFRWYADNGMYRLNLPNDVPQVQAARLRRTGILVVSVSEEGGVEARIVFEPSTIQDAEARSAYLGTLGRTQTRKYGWY